jgi:hypothetical protein
MANAPTGGHWPELSIKTNWYQRLIEAQPDEGDREAIRAALRFTRSPKGTNAL